MPSDGNPRNSMEELPKLMTFRLSRLHARTNAHAARLLKKHAGISLSEWRIFVMIETNGKITPAQIVKITKFDKGLVSRTIKGMQEKGLLTVELSENDQRSHVIDFTPEGLATAEKACPVMRKRQDMLRGCLEPTELEQLFAAFDKIDTALSHSRF